MKMNVYADKCALKYKKEGGVWKKDRPRVCDDKGLVFIRGSVISYWDDQ